MWPFFGDDFIQQHINTVEVYCGTIGVILGVLAGIFVSRFDFRDVDRDIITKRKPRPRRTMALRLALQLFVHVTVGGVGLGMAGLVIGSCGILLALCAATFFGCKWIYQQHFA